MTDVTVTEAPVADTVDIEAPVVPEVETPEVEAKAPAPARKPRTRKAPAKKVDPTAVVLTADRDALHAAAALASRASSGSSAIPGYGVLHVVASNRKGTIRGTDGDVEVTSRFAYGERKKVEMHLPSALFTAVLGACPSGEVEVTVAKGTATVVAGDYKATMQLDGVEAPAPMHLEGEPVAVPAFELAAAIGRALTSVSYDSARPLLTGIQIREDGAIASTDSYRLTVLHPNLPEEMGGAIYDSRSLAAVIGLVTADDDTVEFRREGYRFSVTTATGSVVGRTMDGEFPKWDALLPAKHALAMTVNRDELIEGVRRALPIVKANGPETPVKLVITPDSVEVESMASGIGTTAQPIDAAADGKLEVAFRSSFLLDALRSFDDDEIVMELNDAQKPAVIHGGRKDEHLHLLMPIRIV